MRKSDDELRALYGEDYVVALGRHETDRLDVLVAGLPLSSTDAVVDFGCGNAALLPVIGSRIGAYTGVDFAPAFIAAAKARGSEFPSATFICSDIKDFCRDHPGRFDAAFALDFSEHVYDDDWLAMLRSMRSSLKSGGRLYLHTPNAEFIIEQMKARNFILRQFPEHIAVRSPAENRRIVEEAGFTVQKLALIAHYNVLRHLHVLSFLPWVGRHFKARIFIEAEAP